jgi:predicted nucleotidyltransferase
MTADTRLRKIITEIVDRISKGYKPKKVILFGSYAYGKPTEDSDIDLLIIKNTDKRPIDRWIEVKRLLRDSSRTIPVSPLIYTEKEVEQRLAIRDFFLEEIFEKGEILYG